jgi:mono/diheme cytochrome c family protein
MKPWIRNTLLAGAALLLAVIAGVAGLVWRGEQLRQRVVALPPQPAAPAFDDSPAARERGAYLYASRGCADCHGANGAGRTFVHDGALRLAGPAIHSGPGSVVANYSAEDWARTIRHGVKPDGRPLMVMPSEDYNRFTDADVAALVAHVRHLPPAGGGAAVLQMPLPVRALYGAGLMRDAAAKIDHRLPPQQPVPEGLTVAHGRYVAEICKGCHGPDLAGGRIPGAPPDWPAAARLKGGGVMQWNVMPRPTRSCTCSAVAGAPTAAPCR